MGAPELRQFQVTIYIETHCKHRRKKSIYGGQSRSTEKIIPCTVHLTLSTPIGQSKFARLPFLRFHWHFLNNSELLKTSLQTSTWRCGQFIHATAPNEKKRAFIREIDLFLMPAMQLYFWERAKAACYLYVAYVRNVVAAILNLILLLRKIAIGESSIPWNRSLRAKTEDGVSGGQLPPISYSSTWRYARRTV